MSTTVSFKVPSAAGPAARDRLLRARGPRRAAAPAARHRSPPAGLGPGGGHPGDRARRDRRGPARLRRVAGAARGAVVRPGHRRRPCSARSARPWSWTARTWRATPSAVCWPWNWAARSSYGPSPRCPPPGSGRGPSGATPSGYCSRCGSVARRLPLPLIERLSRSAAGRTVLTSTIYARPGPPFTRGRRRRDARPGAGRRDSTQTLAGRYAPSSSRDDVPGLPVTVAWGTRDRLLLRRQGVRAKQIIPRARLVRLPGCGHCPDERRPRARRARHPRRQPLSRRRAPAQRP